MVMYLSLLPILTPFLVCKCENYGTLKAFQSRHTIWTLADQQLFPIKVQAKHLQHKLLPWSFQATNAFLFAGFLKTSDDEQVEQNSENSLDNQRHKYPPLHQVAASVS